MHNFVVGVGEEIDVQSVGRNFGFSTTRNRIRASFMCGGKKTYTAFPKKFCYVMNLFVDASFQRKRKKRGGNLVISSECGKMSAKWVVRRLAILKCSRFVGILSIHIWQCVRVE